MVVNRPDEFIPNGLLDERLKPVVGKLQLVAEEYLNTSKIKLELTYFQLSRRQDNAEDIPGGSFHVNDNKPNIKFLSTLAM